MNTDIKLLNEKFEKIKEMGWIKSDRTDTGAIGITFEKLIGIPSNEFEIPDFGNIEIKTKSKSKYSYISLFNCVPTGPHYHEVERIKDLFGYPDSKLRSYNVLGGDAFSNKLSKIGRDFYFKLNIYRDTKKITLSVFDNKKIKIEEVTYWDFDVLEEKLNRKLSYLAVINALKKSAKSEVFFRYYKISFYKLKGFETFIDLIEDGTIKITFKLGIYRDEKRLGKIHDRGTSFGIDEKNLTKLYDSIK